MAARILIITGCTAVLAGWLLCPARAMGPVLAEIEEIDRDQLYEQRFSLPVETAVEIDAVGSGWRDENTLFTYPWILDLRTRRLVWQMKLADARDTQHEHNLQVTDNLTLPAGDYALYFSATGGTFPIRKQIKVFGIFNLGSLAINGKYPVKWNEYGDPHEWHVTVRAVDENVVPMPPAALPRDLGALLRLAPVTDLSYRKAALEVSAPIRVRILAIGEYAGAGRGFADGAWIIDRSRCRRVWEMTLENTTHAGGADKNRMYDGEVTIEPGRYMACYGSDDSHAYGSWNSTPPYDPESWGLTLFPAGVIPRGAVQVILDPQPENLIVKLGPAGDSAFLQKGFVLTHPADFCVRSLGEQMHTEDRMVDFGWIEDAATRQTVWSMEKRTGVFAGGEQRNRLVEDQIHLDPGSYLVGYITDDSHSAERWRDHPPFDLNGWGIALCGAGADFSNAWIGDFKPEMLRHAVIVIAPVRDDESRSVDFEVKSPTRVRITALGEGSDHAMYDYAWLSNATGQKIWRMEYDDTDHAGGADKNRRIQIVVALDPGRYSLNYHSDDSHAFGDWNADPPDEPYRWGVTLVEIQ